MKMGKLKRVFWNLRVVILIAAILIALISINPHPWNDGAAIRNILRNSSAGEAGLISPNPNIAPVDRERITAINNVPVHNVRDYYNFVSKLQPNTTITIKTTRNLYRLATRAEYSTIILPELENITVTETLYRNISVNGTNKTIVEYKNRTLAVNKTIRNAIGTEDLGISIFEAPMTNIRLGLELQGGTRVLLQPETRLGKDDISILIENMNQRLNLFGLSDVTIRESTDLSGNQYIVVEIAGVNEEEVKELLAKQGKFEAKIGNDTVFRGGQDITYVCRSAGCSGIDPARGCFFDNGQNFCGFRFSISLTPESAARQAALTENLKIIKQPSGGDYLEKTLDLYLDDQLVDTLNIGAELKGAPVTEISISGSGSGSNQQEAVASTLYSMKRLQTILITGSLPVKLNIIQSDSISPALGSKFIQNAILAGIFAIIAVIIVLLIAYRNPIIAIPILVTSLVEIFIMLGVAAIIKQNIDLAAIAGIIAAVGTGVNDQIIITDEALKGEKRNAYSWKDKIKNAFFIIMGAYLTLMVAMLPLLFAGAGLLKGFALVTIIGISAGVFITRPAYAKVIEILTKQ